MKNVAIMILRKRKQALSTVEQGGKERHPESMKRKFYEEETLMKKTKIKLDAIADVKEFVNIVSHCEYDVDLASGRYAVDAKSIMGIFSLDLGNAIDLTAHTDNADEFFKKIEKFIVK